MFRARGSRKCADSSSPGGLSPLPRSTARLPSRLQRVCLKPEFPRSGIEDSVDDHALDGIAPAGYYRGTFQAKEYTIREFGRYFQVLEYIERGAMNFQDLIVLRK